MNKSTFDWGIKKTRERKPNGKEQKMTNTLEVLENLTNNPETIKSFFCPLDIDFCEFQQLLYEKLKAKLQKSIQDYDEIIITDRSSYCNSFENLHYNTIQVLERYKQDEKSKLSDSNKSFTMNIVSYFQSKYSISLNVDKIWENFKYLKNDYISYLQILPYVKNQLQGLTFEEKAMKEIKEAFVKVTGRKDVTLTKEKVAIPSLVCVNYCKYANRKELSFYSRDKFGDFFKGLNAFETEISNESVRAIRELQECVSTYNQKEDILFATYELNTSKIKSFRLFKNGKAELVFTSKSYAEEFFRDFINFSE